MSSMTLLEIVLSPETLFGHFFLPYLPFAYLSIMIIHFVFLWILCLCICEVGGIFWVCVSQACFYLVLFLFACFISLSVCFVLFLLIFYWTINFLKKRKRRCGVGLVGIWEEMREGKYDQNIMYEKVIFNKSKLNNYKKKPYLVLWSGASHGH